MRFAYDRSVSALCFGQEDQFGEVFDVIVARRTFIMTKDGLRALEEQPDLLDTDLYFGELLASSVRAESELAPFKPRCDVIVNATARVPAGAAARSVIVTLQVERGRDAMRLIDKSLVVTGERWWRRRALPVRLALGFVTLATFGLVRLRSWRLGRPAPFSELPLRYESAYGGECRIDAAPDQRDRLRRAIGADSCLTEEQLRMHPDAGNTGPVSPLAHMASDENPIGLGFCRDWYVRTRRLDRVPAPRIMPAETPATSALLWQAMHDRGAPPAAGYGCVGRAWLPRRAQIGEIDMDCEPDDDACPRLPDDFDYGYWNAAPRDQQCPYLEGGERITLVNLCRADHPLARRAKTGDTVLAVTLPDAQPYLALLDERERIAAWRMALDTVVVEPDECLVTLTWRAVLPAKAGLTDAELRFAASADEKAALQALLEIQGQLPPDEELADAA